MDGEAPFIGPMETGNGTNASTRPVLLQMRMVWSACVLSAALLGSCTPDPEPPSAIEEASRAFGYRIGSDEAPVRVMEFSDYGCGYCRQFHAEVFGMVKEEFVDTGKVSWTFIPFASGLFLKSPGATRGAQCVLEQGQEVFEHMNAALWERQGEWKRGSGSGGVVRSIAESSGADLERYDECVTSDRASYWLERHGDLARQFRIRGTPTFIIEGYRPIEGTRPVELFRDLLNGVYHGAQREYGAQRGSG